MMGTLGDLKELADKLQDGDMLENFDRLMDSIDELTEETKKLRKEIKKFRDEKW